MDKLILVGIGTNARLAYYFIQYHKLYDVIGFAVNQQYKNSDKLIDLPVYTLENLSEEVGHSNFKVFIDVLWNRLNSDRRYIYNYCIDKGYEMANLISPLAVLRSEITGNNIWIHDHVVIQHDTVIGSNTAIMQGTLIGANCKVGPHCFFGAHAILGGGSIVGEQSFIGIRATVFDGTIIGKKCIVGACTPVKRNMPDFSKYATSSDVVIKQYSEDEICEKLMYKLNKR